MKKYRKKPVEIQAIQLTEENILQVYRFINGYNNIHLKNIIDQEKWDNYESICKRNGGIRLKTMESDNETQIATFGDFIIKGIKGEFYPCKPDVFKQMYEEVN